MYGVTEPVTSALLPEALRKSGIRVLVSAISVFGISVFQEFLAGPCPPLNRSMPLLCMGSQTLLHPVQGKHFLKNLAEALASARLGSYFLDPILFLRRPPHAMRRLVC